ncbi:MAG: alpha-amylase [Rhodobacteraceae bacterium]|nr:alpha-amylase [Paracoccaceae bacterium]
MATAETAPTRPKTPRARKAKPKPAAARPLDPAESQIFDLRWQRSAPHLLGPLARIYGEVTDMDALSARLRDLLERYWAERPADLKALDLERDLNPDWFLDQSMVGYVFYIDRFAGTLRDVPAHIPYLKDLGVTYVHFMPCLKPRPGDSDGGYAVADYREIDPRYGTMADFEAVAAEMRKAGISICIDLVLSHTAKEHESAEKARAGDAYSRDLYRMFDDDTMPKLYERSLLEIFPDQAPGNFTWYPDIGKWVWTTFNEFQWDLNWENPEVFLNTLETILYLANRGVEVFRLDAVAFLWKQMGTICQNLPQVHDLLQALRQATRVACPGVIHKAEAIVGPADLVPYLGQGRHAGRESNLAYHNNLMVQYWSSLASGDTRLMTHVMRKYFPEGFRNACFATYIRCHDDIGWAITEEDCAELGGITGPGHRTFLANFYNGSFPGSFARGADFQYNPLTGDRRTNGSFASLAGLEAALAASDVHGVDLAVNRILMGHALIASFGGIPLIYMGDEIGLLNDHGYRDDPDLAADGRWMHRPFMDWDAVARLSHGEAGPAAWIHAGTRHILDRRKATPELASWVPTRILDTGHPHVFAFARPADERTLTAAFNFTGQHQTVAAAALGIDPHLAFEEVITGRPVAFHGGGLHLPPYGRAWLVPV